MVQIGGFSVRVVLHHIFQHPDSPLHRLVSFPSSHLSLTSFHFFLQIYQIALRHVFYHFFHPPDSFHTWFLFLPSFDHHLHPLLQIVEIYLWLLLSLTSFHLLLQIYQIVLHHHVYHFFRPSDSFHYWFLFLPSFDHSLHLLLLLAEIYLWLLLSLTSFHPLHCLISFPSSHLSLTSFHLLLQIYQIVLNHHVYHFFHPSYSFQYWFLFLPSFDHHLHLLLLLAEIYLWLLQT